MMAERKSIWAIPVLLAVLWCLPLPTPALECMIGSLGNHEKMTTQECGRGATVIIDRNGTYHHTVNNSQTDKDNACIITKLTRFDHQSKLVTQVDFHCDLEICANASLGPDNVVTEYVDALGYLATVYCCYNDSCNTPEVAETLKPPNITCHNQVLTYHSREPMDNRLYCPSAVCLNISSYVDNELLSASYFCDTNNTCNPHNLGHDQCGPIEDLKTGITTEACCCKLDDCNQPRHHLKFRSPVPPSANNSKLNWVSVTGILAAIILLGFLVATIVVSCRKYRRLRLWSNQREFAYQQFTADFALDPTAPVYQPSTTPTDERNDISSGPGGDTVLI